MEITSGIEDRKATLTLAGKLTVQTSSELNAAVEALPDRVCDVDIDLREVDYVSSAGLRVFVAADKLAVRRGGRVRPLNPCDDVMSALEMTGLAEVFAIEQ